VSAAPQAGWRILVPLDGTVEAERALAYASTLARSSGGGIMLIRACDPEADSGPHSVTANAQRLREASISVEWGGALKSDDPVAAILDAAALWRADLIAMATTRWSALDRLLNGSVTDAVIRAARAPVLVVPPNWDRPLVDEAQHARILLPLDGSRLAEQAVDLVLRLATVIAIEVVLLRAVAAGDPGTSGAQEYLRQVRSRLESILGRERITLRLDMAEPAAAILEAARICDIDAIALATHGRSGIRRALRGGTATAVIEGSSVPLLVLGPGALLEPTTAQIRLRAPVRTLDNERVGEVHRLVLDLDQRAVVSLVVLGRGPLARDVLVPIEFVESVEQGDIQLRLTLDELDDLPDFAFNEFLTPPPTWTSFVPAVDGPTLVPATQRKRVGPGDQDITPGTRVAALDGDLGSVDRIEVDRYGQIEAFWLRTRGIFATDMRIPAEWVERDDRKQGLRVRANRAEIESYLGYESRRRLITR
jgi:nucleotide-binding universal stress UspA family protein